MIFFIGIVLTVAVFIWLFAGGNLAATTINLIWFRQENIPLVAIVTVAFSSGFVIAYLLGLFTYFQSMIKDIRIKNLEKALSDQQTRMMNIEDALAKERAKIKELEKIIPETRLTVPEKKTGLVAVIKDKMQLSKWLPQKKEEDKKD